MNVEMAEASARAAAVLRKQADRWWAQADAQEVALAAQPALRFDKDHGVLRDEATLARMHADLIVRHARARAILQRVAGPLREDAARLAAQRFLADGDVKALHEALSVRSEDLAPVEWATYQSATAEMADTARLWRGIGLAAGTRGRMSEWVQDNVDDTPDPADVAVLVEEIVR